MWLVMIPLRWVIGGGDQEKTTSLCPATASNISGAPEGAVAHNYIYNHFSYSHGYLYSYQSQQ